MAAFPVLVLGAGFVYPCSMSDISLGAWDRLSSVITFFSFSKSSVADAEVLVTHAFSLVLTLIVKYHACRSRYKTEKIIFPTLSQ